MTPKIDKTDPIWILPKEMLNFTPDEMNCKSLADLKNDQNDQKRSQKMGNVSNKLKSLIKNSNDKPVVELREYFMRIIF